jgi:hypothetical protein
MARARRASISRAPRPAFTPAPTKHATHVPLVASLSGLRANRSNEVAANRARVQLDREGAAHRTRAGGADPDRPTARFVSHLVADSIERQEIDRGAVVPAPGSCGPEVEQDDGGICLDGVPTANAPRTVAHDDVVESVFAIVASHVLRREWLAEQRSADRSSAAAIGRRTVR